MSSSPKSVRGGEGRRRVSPWVYPISAIAIVVAGFPIYWMINTALSSQTELYTQPQPLVPGFSNFEELFKALEGTPVVGMLTNSFFIAAGTTILTIILSVFTAYALSRFRFRGRGPVAFLLFATQMVPEGVFLIPIYVLFLSLGLVNNLTGLVLVNAAFCLPISTFIIKAGIDAIPVEIEEAARVDNSPRLAILSTIVIPLVLPSIASAAILSFFAGWGEFMYAATFITSQDKWPASVGLAVLMKEPGASIPAVMVVAILFSAPAIAFFLLAQRQMVTGLTAGAVKG